MDIPPLAETSAIFAVFFLLGVFQSAPSVTTGDAGEFAAAAATLGIPHAPGYALFVLVARIFGTLFPFGSWAYRGNLLSSFCSALSLALLCDAFRRFGASRIPRLGAIFVLGLMPLWREQSAVTEVFSLLVLCAVASLWLVSAAEERILEPGPSAALGLVFSLGLGAHQTLTLILPALALAGAAKPARMVKAVAFAALGTVAGFSAHLILPLRAAQSPPLDWDHAVTFSAFKRLLLRSDYGTLSLTTEGGQAAGLEGLAAQAWRSLQGMGAQLGPLGTALALLGAALWRRAGLRLPAAAAYAWVLVAGPLFLMLGRPPFDPLTSGALERFHLLPLVGAALFVAAGLEGLRALRPAAAAAAALAAALALVPGAVAQSRRGDFLAYDYGRTILRELPRRSVLVMDGGDDTFYSLAALTLADGLRGDVTLHDRGGVVFRSPYGADFRSLSREAKEARRRAVESALASAGTLYYSTLNEKLLPGWDLRPMGLLRRPLKPGAKESESGALRETLTSARAPAFASRYRDRNVAGFLLFQRGADAAARGDAAAASAWLSLSAAAAGDSLWAAPAISYALAMTGYAASARGDWAAAARAYRTEADLGLGGADPWSNLGVALQRQGALADAEAALRQAVRLEPRAPRVWQTLGGILWAESRWADCASAYDSAAALAPGDPSSAAWAAKARAKAGSAR